MAKKKFTDITIKLCQRDCTFKRVTNETLTKFADKAEKEYDEKVKTFMRDFETVDEDRELLEKQLKLLYKKVDILENKEDKSEDEIEDLLGLLDEIGNKESELSLLKAQIVKFNEENPIPEYLKKVDELLAEKVETFLDGITAKQFLKESDSIDTIKARNLEKYYQLAIVGERESVIVQEMKDDVEASIKSDKEFRQ